MCLHPCLGSILHHLRVDVVARHCGEVEHAIMDVEFGVLGCKDWFAISLCVLVEF